MFIFFFFNDTPTPEIYTLSLHDALPISMTGFAGLLGLCDVARAQAPVGPLDRKSTRLNSSHTVISYAVFCLKKKKTVAAAGVGRGCRAGHAGRVAVARDSAVEQSEAHAE